MIRYRRDISQESFKCLYEYAEHLMILTYYYKKILFPINTLGYNCEKDNWSPSEYPELSKFLVAASTGLNFNVTPKDFLAAAIDYRKVVLFRKMVLDDNYFISEIMLKALEIYLWNKNTYGGSYESPSIPELSEIELKYILKKSNSNRVWKVLSEFNGETKAIKLILSTDLYLHIERKFLESIPEFKKLRTDGFIIWDKVKYIWIG